MILKNQKGSVLVEFAIVLPILIVLIYAVQDLATYATCSKKIEKIAKNTVNLPSQLKQIYDSEEPTDIDKYEDVDATNMLLAIINASKMIYYTYSSDITKYNFPKIVLCWTLVKSTKVESNYKFTVPWRVFIKLTKDAIRDNQIHLRDDNIEIAKNLTYDSSSYKFDGYDPAIDFSDMDPLRYKIPGNEGYLLVLDVFDYDSKNKKLYFSSLYPESFFKFHKTAYQFLQEFKITKNLSTKLEEVET